MKIIISVIAACEKKTKTFPIIYDLHTAVWVKTYIFFECRQIYHSNSSYDNK